MRELWGASVWVGFEVVLGQKVGSSRGGKSDMSTLGRRRG